MKQFYLFMLLNFCFVTMISAQKADLVETEGDFYKFLEGKWTSPKEEAITWTFDFNDDGLFTIKGNPNKEFFPEDVDFEEFITKFQTNSGEFILLNFADEYINSLGLIVELEMDMMGMLSTNYFEVLDDKINIINQDTKERTLFLHR